MGVDKFYLAELSIVNGRTRCRVFFLILALFLRIYYFEMSIFSKPNYYSLD